MDYEKIKELMKTPIIFDGRNQYNGKRLKEKGFDYSCVGKKKMRDGCALCCNASEKERQEWFEDYPEAIPLVIELQNIVKEQRPDRPPLRDYKYFIE